MKIKRRRSISADVSERSTQNTYQNDQRSFLECYLSSKRFALCGQHPLNGAFPANGTDSRMPYHSLTVLSWIAALFVVANQGRGHWSATETTENSYAKTVINRTGHTSDDLQWKRGRTIGINERFGSCCVTQDDLYTSMREGLKQITATITKSTSI